MKDNYPLTRALAQLREGGLSRAERESLEELVQDQLEEALVGQAISLFDLGDFLADHFPGTALELLPADEIIRKGKIGLGIGPDHGNMEEALALNIPFEVLDKDETLGLKQRIVPLAIHKAAP